MVPQPTRELQMTSTMMKVKETKTPQAKINGKREMEFSTAMNK
jgi:hypothetical protein